ncbi:DUF3977 family protein [Paenibacillus gorillae]|uniref:DUF3977 family protein n=1 Tax=Paenibacillus gorillae TaxID=1243662 RepID=UPI0005A87817|nr:DUF3977 family protein [Paenibacillus gorillae]
MKYIEFGIGNTWLVRTETERADGTEFEQKGIVKPIVFHSVYFRVWLGKKVFIWDSKEGLKRMNKTRSAFKLLFGITSHQ